MVACVPEGRVEIVIDTIPTVGVIPYYIKLPFSSIRFGTGALFSDNSTVLKIEPSHRVWVLHLSQCTTRDS